MGKIKVYRYTGLYEPKEEMLEPAEALKVTVDHFLEMALLYATCQANHHDARKGNCLVAELLSASAYNRVATQLLVLAEKRECEPVDPSHTHKASVAALREVARELVFVSRRCAEDVNAQSRMNVFNVKSAQA